MDHMKESDTDVDYLKTLRKAFSKAIKSYLFPCIEDLVKNGLSLSRFSSDEFKPMRVDITKFIASWFKFTGLAADEYRQWLIDYSTDILSVISSSSKSRIRHSTKSIIKYIHNSDISFECDCENNQFKAVCAKSCPVYTRMLQLAQEKEARKANVTYEITEEDRLNRQKMTYTQLPQSKREEFKEQYEKAMLFVKEKAKSHISIKNLISLLDEDGYKSAIGKTWTYSALHNSLKENNIKIPRKTHPAGKVKNKYRAQFEKALIIVLEKLALGLSTNDIVSYLNENGYKTRTGRPWTVAVLKIEIKRKA